MPRTKRNKSSLALSSASASSRSNADTKASTSTSSSASSRPLPLGWICMVVIAYKFGKYSSLNEMEKGQRCLKLVKNAIEEKNNNQQQQQQMLSNTSNSSTSTSSTLSKNDGWHSIDVFYGNTSHLDATQPPPAFRGPRPLAIQDWYGQVQQDRIVVEEIFHGMQNGYFIDLAANDARTFSNTFALERRYNWNGLCIEPNPMYWYDLSYRKCQVVAAVVGKYRMEEVQFRFQNGVLGGIVDDKFDNKPTNDEQNHPQVPSTYKYTVPLQEILERYNVPSVIDYLSLDVEGAEEYIMMGIFPFHKYSIRVMTIERPSENLQLFLKQQNFTNIRRLSRWGETLFVHNSFLEEQQKERIAV